MRFNKILKLFCSDVWLIDPDKLEVIAEVLNVRLAGGAISGAEIKALAAQAKESVGLDVLDGDGDGDDVAVIKLYGTLAQRTEFFSLGFVSVERFGKHFNEAMEDPSVGSIVLDIDSPGGSLFGIEEMAEKIYKARGRKKIVAVANSMAASGAYWIGAAADELVVTPSGEVGSIGVVCLHQDLSGAYAQIGVVNTIIKAGKYKIEANSFEELNDDAKEYIQQRVNTTYAVFTKSLAKFRGVGVAEVRKHFGQGRMKLAPEAVGSRMADAVGTRDWVIAELQKNKYKSFGSRTATKSETAKLRTETRISGIDIENVQATAAKKVMAANKIRLAGLKAIFPNDPACAMSHFVASATVQEAKDLRDKLLAAFPDDAAFAMEQLAAGATVTAAKAAYCQVLSDRLEIARLAKIKVEGAEPIFAGEAGSDSGGDFHEQAKATAKAEGISYRQAASELAKEQPDLHRAYVDVACQVKT